MVSILLWNTIWNTVFLSVTRHQCDGLLAALPRLARDSNLRPVSKAWPERSAFIELSRGILPNHSYDYVSGVRRRKFGCLCPESSCLVLCAESSVVMPTGFSGACLMGPWCTEEEIMVYVPSHPRQSTLFRDNG